MYIAICDDERSCSDTTYNFLVEYLGDKDIDFCIEIFTNAEEVINTGKAYDFVFMDIQMRGMNGLTAAKKLLERKPDTLVFFITHYQIYLDKAMDISPFRYLSKPLKKARFFESLYVGLNKWKQRQKNITVTEDRLRTKFLINVYDVLYIENLGRKVRIVTKNKDFSIIEPYKDIRAELIESDDFCDSHQSFTVNLNYVTFYDKSDVHIEYGRDKHIIHMSRRKYAEFHKHFFRLARDIV